MFYLITKLNFTCVSLSVLELLNTLRLCSYLNDFQSSSNLIFTIKSKWTELWSFEPVHRLGTLLAWFSDKDFFLQFSTTENKHHSSLICLHKLLQSLSTDRRWYTHARTHIHSHTTQTHTQTHTLTFSHTLDVLTRRRFSYVWNAKNIKRVCKPTCLTWSWRLLWQNSRNTVATAVCRRWENCLGQHTTDSRPQTATDFPGG